MHHLHVGNTAGAVAKRAALGGRRAGTWNSAAFRIFGDGDRAAVLLHVGLRDRIQWQAEQTAMFADVEIGLPTAGGGAFLASPGESVVTCTALSFTG